MGKYAIGVDFGTLSGRALLVDLESGAEAASAAYDYPHGVMDEALPGGARLGRAWALQDPQDYLDVLAHTIPAVLREAGVAREEVVGVGTDFTACTMLPVKADGTPLCFLPEYKNRPHAYVKLWKHHAAQDKADRLNQTAQERGEPWLKYYGGKTSSEWAIPKLWQLLEEDEALYRAMDRWIEASDWIVWQLCGREVRSSCAAGYKALYRRQSGYPSPEFFRALDPRLEHVVDEKLSRRLAPLGGCAGFLTEKAARLTGLAPGTPVAVGGVDAHACVPAAGIDGPGRLLAIMGTSTCHMVMSREELPVPGICGVAQDGILPGFFGYEAGQACVGDHFAWFLQNCLPAAYSEAAKAQGKNLHQYLREKAQGQRPGESGLLALDWWNGNRSVLSDGGLTGLLLGMTLQTKPEDIYRALIEATAYGTRLIVENYRSHGVPVEEFIASGGIARKDPMTMQIYADVLNMPVKSASSAQGPALGSAIFASVAAGSARGGWDDLYQAIRALGSRVDAVYRPIPEHTAVYGRLFSEYLTLHDYFGRGGNDVMKRLHLQG